MKVVQGNVSTFTQINSTFLAFVVSQAACIQLLQRETATITHLAGRSCVNPVISSGDLDAGITLIEMNTTSSNTMVVFDIIPKFTILNLVTATVNQPDVPDLGDAKCATWFLQRFIVCTGTALGELHRFAVSYYSFDLYAGDKRESGYCDDSLFGSRFKGPHDMTQISHSHFLVADNNPARFRLLDLEQERVLLVCIGSDSCTESTELGSHNFNSIVKTKYGILASYGNSIYMLKGE